MKKMLSMILLSFVLTACVSEFSPPPPPPPPPMEMGPGYLPPGAMRGHYNYNNANGHHYGANNATNATNNHSLDTCKNIKTKIGVLQATHASKSEINDMKHKYRNMGC